MPPRDELVRLHRRIVRELKREIQGTLYGGSGAIRRYAAEYEGHFHGPWRVVPWRDLLERAARAEVIFHGDFHTLCAAQLSPIGILRDLRRAGRPVCLAMETFCARDQALVDRYQAGEIPEAPFLRSIEYARTWGFDWRGYGRLVRFAREAGIPILALDCRHPTRRVPLRRRDRFAAERIAARRRAHPGEIVYVLFGELHVAPDHLPAALAAIRPSCPPRPLILFQNNETVYWRLAAQGLEAAEVVQLGADRFCLVNSTPLVIYHAHRAWIERQERIALAGEGGGEIDALRDERLEEMLALVRLLACFLGIRHPGLDDFSVQTSRDVGFLEVLRRKGRLTPARARWLRREARLAPSLLVPEGRTIYLPTPSLDAAAEEAARFLHVRLAGGGAAPRSRRDRFYQDVMLAALGFLGSKIVNPKRRVRRPSDYRRIVLRLAGRPLSPETARLLELARMVMVHLDPRASHLRLYRLPRHQHRDLAGAIGHLLGDDLFDALLEGRCSKGAIRDLFATPLGPPRAARDAYLAWRERAAPRAATLCPRRIGAL